MGIMDPSQWDERLAALGVDVRRIEAIRAELRPSEPLQLDAIDQTLATLQEASPEGATPSGASRPPPSTSPESSEETSEASESVSMELLSAELESLELDSSEWEEAEEHTETSAPSVPPPLPKG